MFGEILLWWICFMTDCTFERCWCGMWSPFMCLKTVIVRKSSFTSTKWAFKFELSRIQRWLTRLIWISFFGSFNKIADTDFWMFWTRHNFTAVRYSLMVVPCRIAVSENLGMWAFVLLILMPCLLCLRSSVDEQWRYVQCQN